jgi:hypothetical protein
MKSKKSKIVVTDLREINLADPKASFKVVKMTNTIEFTIDQYLSTKEVEDKIKYDPDMTVEIQKRK